MTLLGKIGMSVTIAGTITFGYLFFNMGYSFLPTKIYSTEHIIFGQAGSDIIKELEKYKSVEKINLDTIKEDQESDDQESDDDI